LSDELTLIENYNYERVRVFDIQPTFIPDGVKDPATTIVASDDIKSAVTTGVVWDTRDYVFDATGAAGTARRWNTPVDPWGATSTITNRNCPPPAISPLFGSSS
jgi:hypothetical protein